MARPNLKTVVLATAAGTILAGCASLNPFSKADERWADYQSWTKVTEGTEPTGDPTGLLAVVHKGPEGFRDVYVNDIGMATLMGAEPYDYPVGSVVVKEQFDSRADWEAGKNPGLTISVKVAEGAGNKDNWIWSTGYKAKAGPSAFCSGCHTAAIGSDFVFTNAAFLEKHSN